MITVIGMVLVFVGYIMGSVNRNKYAPLTDRRTDTQKIMELIGVLLFWCGAITLFVLLCRFIYRVAP